MLSLNRVKAVLYNICDSSPNNVNACSMRTGQTLFKLTSFSKVMGDSLFNKTFCILTKKVAMKLNITQKIARMLMKTDYIINKVKL